ncbi:transcription factor ORG2-like [Rutidosis leptorrhynchoides]|uniref:transcription factor ORG2-like n=1 Tax=Rutidosis leptorrhynchoides TaxID=125765 RepID=UPI003A9A57F1
MCALSSLFPNIVWPLEDPILSTDHHHLELLDNNLYNLFELPSQQEEGAFQLDRSLSFRGGNNSCDINIKKVNHNAQERDRRKKINSLYSSLRSLLPPENQLKKLSIPGTVSQILKYIPELQQEVDRLNQKKEELLSKISKQDDFINAHEDRKRKNNKIVANSTISANRLSESEVLVKISTFKTNPTPLSKMLLALEEDGLMFVNSSSFDSFGERLFHHLHFQVEKGYKLDCDVLDEKLFCEKRQRLS